MLAAMIIDGAQNERQQTLLDECRERRPPVPDAVLELLTDASLFHRDPTQRTTLRGVAARLAPQLLDDAECQAILEPILRGAQQSSSSGALRRTDSLSTASEEGVPSKAPDGPIRRRVRQPEPKT